MVVCTSAHAGMSDFSTVDSLLLCHATPLSTSAQVYTGYLLVDPSSQQLTIKQIAGLAPHLHYLTWCCSLGNVEGVEEQIAYTQQNKQWYLPARWYNTTLGAGDSSINMVALHSSCFIDKYLKPSNKYSKSEEVQICVSPLSAACMHGDGCA